MKCAVNDWNGSQLWKGVIVPCGLVYASFPELWEDDLPMTGARLSRCRLWLGAIGETRRAAPKTSFFDFSELLVHLIFTQTLPQGTRLITFLEA
jgi:hypothetical protein